MSKKAKIYYLHKSKLGVVSITDCMKNWQAFPIEKKLPYTKIKINKK